MYQVYNVYAVCAFAAIGAAHSLFHIDAANVLSQEVVCSALISRQ